MTTETATNSGADGSAVAPGVAAPNASDNLENQSTEQVEGEEGQEGTQAEDDHEEVEHEGKKYRIPKVLLPHVMRDKDYTQKTQALTEQRRALEARATQDETAQQEHIQAVAKVVAIDQRIAQFANVNWDALEVENPAAAQRLFRELQTLKDTRNTEAASVHQKMQERGLAQQREHGAKVEEAKSVLARDIKGWSPELAGKVFDFATRELGMRAAEMHEITDPRIVKGIHRAYQGEAAIKELAALKKAQTTETVQPARTVGSNAGANQRRTTDASGDKLSTDAWIKAENARLKKH